VFDKQVTKDYVFEGKYTTSSLEAISSALIGISKHDNLNAGAVDFKKIPIEEQKKYVTRDAELTMLLAQHKGSVVLRVIKSISRYAEMDYYICCHTNALKWYENKYKKMQDRGEITFDFTPNYKLKKQDYGGGHQINPKKGFFMHSKIFELDVKGMYPTIILNNNYSPDTLNCTCCENDPTALVSEETIDMINQSLKEKGISRRVTKYWICKKRKGGLPIIIEKVLSDRERYLQLLKEEKAKVNPNQVLIEEYNIQQTAAKIFANSGYGLCGNEYFGLSNYKVAECITGEGRRIHKKMEIMAQQEPFNFEIVFGFTDSIFVRVNEENSFVDSENKIQQFIAKCKEELAVTVELKNVFVNSILYGKMNRFVGWTGKENEEPIIKGLDGLANPNPLWIKRWVYRIIDEIIKRPDTRLKTVPNLLNEAIFELENVICKSTNNIQKELRFTRKLRYHPNNYKTNTRVAVIGKLLEKDKGEEIYWYETIDKDEQTKDNYSITAPTPNNTNLQEYKSILLDKLKDTMEITGFDIIKIRSAVMSETANTNPIDQK
jgi:DNA polymerase elongation subunit (family B)